jgi:tetrapyrrole methylase family protein/MazG family protein
VPPHQLKRGTKKKLKRKHRAGAKQVRAKSARRPVSKVRVASVAPAGKRIGELFEAFVALQARLRAPGGCPWDREQTHDTLKTCLIEEAYEVLDALDKGDARGLAEELGDLLLQIVFHADMEREAGRFDICEVISAIHNKMVRRHPHVFGDVKAETPGQVLKNWAKLKAEEKQAGSGGDISASPLVPSALDGIPRSLPALLEAYQLTRRAAQVGFDWENIEGIFDKLHEEASELRAALAGPNDRARREEEVGDMLFVAVNIARFLGLDPEVALKHANLKFKSRFEEMETEAAHSGKRLPQLSKEELEILWEAAKARSRAPSSQGHET